MLNQYTYGGHLVGAFYPLGPPVDLLGLFEGRRVAHVVHDDHAVAMFDVVLTQKGVLLLTGRVENVQQAGLQGGEGFK